MDSSGMSEKICFPGVSISKWKELQVRTIVKCESFNQELEQSHMA